MLSEKILSSKSCYVKQLFPSDISEQYVQWLNDPEVIKFLDINDQTWDLTSCTEYVQNCIDADNLYLMGIYSNDSHEHVGNITLNSINVRHGTFDYGILIGNKNYWGRSIGHHASLLMLLFGFEILGLRKFFGGCYSCHLGSRLLLKQVGAQYEARLKGKAVVNNSVVDQIIFSYSSDDWFAQKVQLTADHELRCLESLDELNLY